MYKYLYGPVVSRRLGISLGIDLFPEKICTFDCIYCECGKTKLLTNERKEYVDLDLIIKEIQDFLKNNPHPDYITFSGSGEPTLYSKIKEVIEFIKNNYSDIKVCVITNGSLLYLKEVREDLYNANLVIPSLNSANEKSYYYINRPHKKLYLNIIINGIANFVKEFKEKDINNQVWLEIFIVKGINDTEEEIKKLREACIYINPDKIQLNSLDRPGTESWVIKVSRKDLLSIKEKFNLSNVEIISRNVDIKNEKVYKNNIEELILSTISRRPLTIDDIQKITKIDVNDLTKIIENLELNNKISKIVISGDIDKYFYIIKK